MSELNFHKHTDEKIIERVSNISFINLNIEENIKLSKFEIYILMNHEKYNNILKNLKYFKADGETETKFFFYDPAFAGLYLADKKEISDFTLTQKQLEQQIRNAFFFTQKVSDIEKFFEAIDANKEGAETDIMKSNVLRAKKSRLISGFYDTATKSFLSLMMCYLYDTNTLKPTGISESEAAENSAKVILAMVNKFEKDLEEEYGGDAILNTIKKEFEKPKEEKDKPKKEIKPKKETKPRTKKTKVTIENKLN